MILCWVNPTWDRGSNFKDYLESQGVNINEVKRNLSKDQRDKFMNPSSHNTWDISMIHVLLFFSICLAGKNDEKWQKQNGSDPEMSLSVLKDKRNETAHNPRIDRGWCCLIIKELYERTIKIQGSLKLVVLGYVVNPEDKEEIEREMDRVFDNTRQKIREIGKGGIGAEVFDEYQREIDFTKKKKLLEEEGFPCLKKILEKLKSINPLNLITGTSSNPNIPVEKIYTEMKLEGESGPSSVPIEEILNHVPHYDHSRFLLIKGMAGMGKTTLVKKIISDWLSKRDDIKGLNDYDILLYVQCRDFIESFKDLLVAFFRDVHQKFQGNEIIEVCLAYKCLLIIDGYDELNDKSSKLFLEVLTLKKSHPISVIVTTRPEFEERFNNQVKSDYTTVSTISLEGIPKEKREEFVCKYYAVLGSGSSPLQSLEELFQYLRKTKHTMHEVWGLPLNLALVTVLWMIKPEVISNITTEAELYWQFHLLSLSKLKERLAKHPKTAFLEPTSTKIGTKKFVEKLCGESFKALQNDEINIPESTINNLSAFCYSLGMPAEELTGAFLKKVTTSQGSFHYSFPHKGIMEFMAALFFPMKLTNHCWGQSVNTATVKKIIEMLLGGSLPENLHKYQNMMIHMISLFHVGDGDEMKVSEDAKIEALELLVRSGVNDKDSVLRVLKNIKCDHSSSRWIAQRFELFDKDTRIQDHTIDAYIALLRATDPPLPNRERIKIRIILNDTDGLVELQRQLCRHRINPSYIHLYDHYKGDSEPTVEERESIKNLLTNDCKEYRGIWDPTFQIPPNIRNLIVVLPDQPSLDAFCRSLERTKEIESLVIRFSVNDVSSVSRPIPFLEKDPNVGVFVEDVKEEDIEKVGDILRTLQPQNARRSFWSISFPLCSLGRTRSPEVILRLLASLKGVRVRSLIQFPEDERPNDEALLREMNLKAKESTGCRYGVYCCKEYRGIWDPTFQIPPNIRNLIVVLPDQPSLDAFCRSLERTKEIESLVIRFSVNDVSSVSRPIPFLEEDPNVGVFVEDVKEEDIEKVGDILRTLQPQNARRSFAAIWFLLCSLGRTRSPEVILRLLASLKGVRVRQDIQFPEEERPDDEALRREMNLKAEESTGCRNGVRWN
ncbi:uncharacterized protein [Palaemon carinicauda]|uniref:uncharacterized protein n=1 Tax=Palaemon carinicauda TaxID=392227 RepID=UPI0035B657ED